MKKAKVSLDARPKICLSVIGSSFEAKDVWAGKNCLPATCSIMISIIFDPIDCLKMPLSCDRCSVDPDRPLAFSLARRGSAEEVEDTRRSQNESRTSPDFQDVKTQAGPDLKAKFGFGTGFTSECFDIEFSRQRGRRRHSSAISHLHFLDLFSPVINQFFFHKLSSGTTCSSNLAVISFIWFQALIASHKQFLGLPFESANNKQPCKCDTSRRLSYKKCWLTCKNDMSHILGHLEAACICRFYASSTLRSKASCIH